MGFVKHTNKKKKVVSWETDPSHKLLKDFRVWETQWELHICRQGKFYLRSHFWGEFASLFPNKCSGTPISLYAQTLRYLNLPCTLMRIRGNISDQLKLETLWNEYNEWDTSEFKIDILCVLYFRAHYGMIKDIKESYKKDARKAFC